MKGMVTVMLKQDVLDVQGQAIQRSLHSLGFDTVQKVRIGKSVEVDLNATSPAEAEAQLRGMCEKLLVNGVIEDYRLQVLEN
ncbi:MAG: phosphoribosylformylglycinamidine synthase subunit PurS [bacterium]|jgi:phosphoribosylformylglycinamidine synthase PurS subunit